MEAEVLGKKISCKDEKYLCNVNNGDIDLTNLTSRGDCVGRILKAFGIHKVEIE